MPDPEITRALGPGLAPTQRFTADVRAALVQEWRAVEPATEPIPPRRSWVPVLAVAAAAALLVTVWAVVRDRRPTVTIGPVSTTSAPPSSAVPDASIPPGRWVVSSTTDGEVLQPQMPWFDLGADGTVTMDSACDASCREKYQPVPPFTFDGELLADAQGRSASRLVPLAESFDLPGRYVGWHGSVTFSPDGWFSTAMCGTLGTWAFDDASTLRLDTGMFEGEASTTECYGSDPVVVMQSGSARVASGPGRIWLYDDRTVLALTRERVVTAEFMIGPDASVLSSSHAIDVPDGAAVAVSPAGDVFVSLPDGEGWTVHQLVDGALEPIGIRSTNGTARTAPDGSLYTLGFRFEHFVQDTDGWTLTDDLPLSGDCLGTWLATEFGCGAQRVALQPDPARLFADLASPQLRLWRDGEQLAYWFDIDPTLQLDCGSETCLWAWHLFEGGAIWTPDIVDRGGLHSYSVVLRPGLEPLVVSTAGAAVVGAADGRLLALEQHDGMDRLVFYDLPAPELGLTWGESVGAGASPSSGGQVVGRWTYQQLEALGQLGEGQCGVLADGRLVLASHDRTALVIVDGEGAVVDEVTLPRPFGVFYVRSDEIAEVSYNDGSVGYVSLAGENLGDAVVPPEVRVTEGADGVVVASGAVEWPLDSPAVSFWGPLAASDGSVAGVLTEELGSGAGAIHLVWAVRLLPNGLVQRVELGSHAADGSEGFAAVQATSTGGLVLFSYGNGNVVAFRYDYPST